MAPATHTVFAFKDGGGTHWNTTVRAPLSITRCSQCALTARVSTRLSVSCPCAIRGLDCVGMVDHRDVLSDDRALIEIRGDVMRGRSHHLDAAIIGPVIGVRALERRQ